MITHRDAKGRIAKGSNKKHGLSDHSIYDCWVAMKARCNNKQNPSYKWYGAKGIKVCDAWNKSFEAFLDDMGIPPKGMTIDRTDVYGNYEPSNCRWVTVQEQQINRSNNNGTPGVYYEKTRNKFQVTIIYKGKKHYIGRFDELKEAVAARKKAELDLWLI